MVVFQIILAIINFLLAFFFAAAGGYNLKKATTREQLAGIKILWWISAFLLLNTVVFILGVFF